MNIRFIGAAQEVTGSKHLITTDSGKRILLDCGMFQGKGLETDRMNRNLQFNPEEIDCIILTHAHIDHSGLIPYMYKMGFRGSIVCTHATRDLCSIMLTDSAHIQELDAKWYNKKANRKGLPMIHPIYNVVHAERCMDLFISVGYNRRFYINEDISVKFTNTKKKHDHKMRPFFVFNVYRSKQFVEEPFFLRFLLFGCSIGLFRSFFCVGRCSHTFVIFATGNNRRS